ncbi:putative membrane protein [Trachipleistophora hominis]|uniref:Putative membrane protein n=1 Tax=Trachipleistophora hominis TaxID=72359 RepID=L7K0L7_TRAHO|nr:putative membrane protein [Trachipleistophora hominis]
MKEYDIVVYGASGFTARHIISHLQKYPLRIALSARTPSKISHNPKNYPVIQCDTNNLEIITSKAMVLLNCAGPYIRCGEAVVESCINNNCHYVDITGETTFINNIIKKFDEKAREKGVYVLNCCGFDSVPSDIGFDILKRKILGRINGDKQIADQGKEMDDKPSDASDSQAMTDVRVSSRNSVSGTSCISIYNFLRFKDVKCNFATFESLVYGLASYFDRPKQKNGKTGDRRHQAK